MTSPVRPTPLRGDGAMLAGAGQRLGGRPTVAGRATGRLIPPLLTDALRATVSSSEREAWDWFGNSKIHSLSVTCKFLG